MAINVNRKEIITRTGELIGYKSGLGLNKEEFDYGSMYDDTQDLRVYNK